MAVRLLQWLTVILLAVLPLAHVPALRGAVAAAVTLVVAGVLLRERRLPITAWPMAVWLALATASILWSVNPGGTVHEVLYAIVLPAGTFLACWRLAQDERAFQAMLFIVVASLLPLAAMVVYVAASGQLNVLQPPDEITGVLRYWPGAGVGSTLACLIAPLALLLLASAHPVRRRAGAATLIAALIVATATLNRAVWPALFASTAAFVAWLWPTLSIPARRAVALLFVAGAAAGWGAFQYVNIERHPDLREVEDLARDVRLQGWREWLGVARETPLLGHGFGHAAVQSAGQGRLSAGLIAREGSLRSHSHNLLLDAVIEIGLIGLGIYCALLATLLWQYWRLGGGGTSSERRILGAAGCSLVVAMLAKNATDDFMQYAVAIAFWAYAGMLLGALEARASRSKPA